ncbi:VOC family virulence protein [Paracoccus zhejiangensis]|uniref:VOC family virulence protein n=1 Tax=Paracoccus zhejiangensis TaxID=1077935 RepID=A0A2H5F428_9RHOB|nr:VOC family virulence protein [Paracoccus zhejiangensis]
MEITGLDYLVLTVRDIDLTIAFYSGILGMRAVTFGAGRTPLHFGSQKINLHRAGHEFEPKARSPLPGSADLCFLLANRPDQTLAALRSAGIAIEEGPVARTGASGPILSVYLRDPDGNLVELGHPDRGDGAS